MKRAPRNSWTKQAVVDSAKAYQSKTEWRKNSHGAYGKAFEMGWLDEACSHMTSKWKKKWDLKSIEIEAGKFSSASDWYKNSPGSYSAASKMGMLKKISATMVKKIHPNGYWTKSRILADALKYSSRSEWHVSSNSAYSMARRNGWFDEAVKHMEVLIEHGKWTKVAILESAKKYIHISKWQKQYPSAYNKALKKGWLSEATLHMVTAPRRSKWTKQLVLEDAMRFSTRGEWHKAEGNAAHVAIVKNWYEEATRHMHRVYSFGEMVIYRLLTQMDISFEVQKRFKTIRSKKPLPFDFYLPGFNLVIEYQGIQHFSESTRKRNESLSEIQRRDELKRVGAESNKLNYLAIHHTIEGEIEDVLLKKLKDLSGEIKGNRLSKKRPLTEQEIELIRSLGSYTKEQLLADARKYQTYPEWRKNSPAFQVAIKNGWLEECKAHMLPEFETRSQAKLVWTKEKVIELAKGYKARSDFKAANTSAYTRARVNGWLDEACSHMKLKIHPNGYWTKERVFDSAKNYKNRKEWMRSKDSTAYNVARKNGWLEEACAHMVWLSTKPSLNKL